MKTENFLHVNREEPHPFYDTVCRPNIAAAIRVFLQAHHSASVLCPCIYLSSAGS